MAEEEFNAICQICGKPMWANPGSGVGIHTECLAEEKAKIAKKGKSPQKGLREMAADFFRQSTRGRKRRINKEQGSKNKKKKNGNGNGNGKKK